MSKKLLSIVVVLSMLLTMLGTALPSLADGPTKTGITIDGKVSDWAGIDPVAIDHAGASTDTNITDLYFTKDSSNIYIRIDGTYIGPNVPMHIGFDTDQSTSTGYNTDVNHTPNIFTQTHGMGIDRVIDLNNGPHPILSSWSSSGQPTPIDTTSLSVASNFVQGQQPPSTFHYEISLPINLMPNAGPWNIVTWVQGPTPPTAVDELPSTGYVTYPLSAPTQRTLTTAVNPASSGTVAKSPDQATYDNGTSVQLTATPATGYQFTNWSGDVTSTDNPVSVTMDADKTVTANFTAIPQGQTWYINNDAYSGGAYGNLTTNPNTPANNQYTYSAGFNYSLQSYAPITFPAGNWVVHFTIVTPITRDVTFGISKADATNNWNNGGGLAAISGAYQLVHLNNANTGTTAVDLTFSLPSFTLTPSGSGLTPGYLGLFWSSGSAAMTLVYGGTNCYLITPPGSPTIACPPYASTLAPTNIQTTSATLSATVPWVGSYSDTSVQFRVTRYDVWDSYYFDATPSPVTNGGTTVTANATGLPAGSSYYIYPIVTYGGGHTTTGRSIDFNTPATPPTQYTLSTTIVGQGTVAKSPDQTTYNSGSTVQLTATPANGWSFAGWSVDASGTTNPVTITMDGNKNVTATFTQNQPTQYTLSITIVGQGTVAKSPDQTTYDSGSSVQLTETPADGWNFASWSMDATGTANPITVTMNGNKNVTANFTQSQTPKPDFTVPSILSYWVYPTAGTYKVQFTIVNNSITPAPASHARFSVDGVLQSEVIDIPALAATGGSNTATFSTTTITLSGDSDTVIVYADGGINATSLTSEVDEQNENNNTNTITVTPSLGWQPKADLTVNEIHAEWVSMPPTDGKYKVHFSITNASPTAAPPSHAKLTIDGTDVETIAIPAIDMGGTYSGYFVTQPVVSAPYDTIVVTADSNNEIDEQFKNNNTQTFIWNVLPGQPPVPTLPNLIVAESHETWDTPNAQTSTYKVYFNIANASPINATGSFKVGYSIDGQPQTETITVNGLAAGANYAGNFTTPLTVSGDYDTIVVSVNVGSSPIAEQFINDNSMTTIWNAKPTPPVNTPSITSLSPNTGVQGATLTGVLINGINLTGATAVTFSGSGVNASNIVVNSATQLTATVTIASDATIGARDVTVATSAGTSTALVGGFTVTAPLPTVTSVSPNSGAQGATLTGVLINGTNLTGATAVTFSGSGVTASSLSVNDGGTQITATVTITGTAALIARDVTVTTPAGTSTALVGGFTVTAPPVPGAGATFTAGPSMNAARLGQANITLPDGRFVVFGGHGSGFTSLNTAEVLAPGGTSFTTLQMNDTHDWGSISKLANGTYLIAGGAANLGIAPGYNTAEIFNPSNNTFTSTTGNMTNPRTMNSSATLSSGKVLIEGGWYSGDSSTYGELYDPATGTFSATGALNTARASTLVLPTADGKAVVIGGCSTHGDSYIEPVELYDPATNSFSVLQQSLFSNDPGWYVSYTSSRPVAQLPDGRYIYIAFKTVNSVTQYTLFTFDPATKQIARVTTSPSLPDSTSLYTYAPLVDQAHGKAYILGIVPDSNTSDPEQIKLCTLDLSTWQLTVPADTYTLSSGWWLEPNLGLLADGRVIITGGSSYNGYYWNYDPVANTLIATPDALPAAIGPTVTTAATTGLSATGVTLHGHLSNKGSAAGDVTVGFKYWATGTTDTPIVVAGTPATLSDVGDFSATITGLVPQTSYTYQAVATGDATNTSATDTFTTTGANWTIMVYMDADNNLSNPPNAALSDINALETAPNSTKVNTIVLYDGATQGDTVAYQIQHNTDTANVTSPVFTPPGGWSWAATNEADMGIPATVTEFVTKTEAAYPATHYALVFWDHGTGWRTAAAVTQPTTKYVCVDSATGHSLKPADIRTALSGLPVGVIGFDACLMQMTEVGYELRNSADVMVGSEEDIPVDGWPYNTILADFINANATADPAPSDLGNLVVNDYDKYYSSNFSDETMSAVELKPGSSGGMNSVGVAISNFANALMGSNKASIQAVYNATTEYYNGDTTYIDLYDFANRISAAASNGSALKNSAEALKTVLLGSLSTAPVVFNTLSGSGHPNSKGLSIYLPSTATLLQQYSALQFAQNTTWDEFLTWFTSTTNEPTWQSIITDPAGDQIGSGPDIVGVDTGNPNPTGQFAYRVRFNASIDLSTSYGETALDTDNNKTTGCPGIGADYMVYVSGTMPTKGMVTPEATLVHWNSTTQGWDIITTAVVSLTAGTNSYWISIPAAAIGSPSGTINVYQFAGVIDSQGGMVLSDSAPKVNNIQVNFNEGYNYNINGNSFTNSTVTGSKNWGTNLNNQPDTSGQPVTAPSATLTSSLTFDGMNPAPSNSASPYQWSFGNIAENSNANINVNASSATVNFNPGFDVTRSITPTTLTSTGDQTLTVTVTPQTQFNGLGIIINTWEDNNANPTITSPVNNPSANINVSGDNHNLQMNIPNPVIGQSYTETFTIHVILKNGLTSYGYMPMVGVNGGIGVDSGITTGNTLSKDIADLGNWTWSATGSYVWNWNTSLNLGVNMQNFESTSLPTTDRMLYLGMNGGVTTPFANAMVRKAVMFALDRDTLANAFGGSKVLSIVTPGIPDANINLGYNPNLAKAMLAEAGYPQGFSCTLTTTPDLVNLATSIQAYLASVGITVTIQLMSPPDFKSQLQSHSLGFFLNGTTNWTQTSDILGHLLLSTSLGNFTGYNSSTFDSQFNSGSYGDAENTAFNSTGYAIAPLYWDYVTPNITVTSPNGSENWTVGSSHNITWMSMGIIGNVNIDISWDGGNNWNNLYSIANSGSQSWTVTSPTTSQALIRVSSVTNTTVSDVSDGGFIISAAGPTLTSIAVTPSNPSVAKGRTQQFTATGTYSDSSTAAITTGITWASSDTGKATINSSGLATTVAIGTTNITATVGSVTSPAVVLTVTAPALVSIAVTPSTPSVAKGRTQQFTATGTYSDSSTAAITTGITWASSDTGKATINSTGLATTVATGTTNITATVGTITSPAIVLTVTAAALDSITVTPATPSITVAGTQQFTATPNYSDGSHTPSITPTWTSSDTSKATIDASSGLATGVAAGTTTITATLGSVSGNTTLTVTAGLTVVTAPSAAQSTTTATLNGTLTGMGGNSSVSVSFEYWVGTGTHTATTPLTYSSPGIFSTNISGLTANTTYNFRAVASAGSNTVYGDTLTLTTPAIDITRVLPTAVAKGQTFNVTVSFSAPGASFNSVGLTDFAPTGWAVQQETQNEDTSLYPLSSPAANDMLATGNKAELTWYGPYNSGRAFTAVYQVTVPSDATIGTYNFTNGTIFYFLGSNSTTDTIGGASQVTVADNIPPTIASTVPANSATDVAVNSTVAVTFSKVMAQSATQGAFSLVPQPSGTAVTGTFSSWSTDGKTMTFTPGSNLSGNTTYLGTISTAATDTATTPNHLATQYQFTFTTVKIAPSVITVTASSTATSATTSNAMLGGSLSSMGTASSVAVSFEYWTGSGTHTTVAGVPSTITTAPTAFSATVTGLTPGLTYSFRALADGGAHGTSTGNTVTFVAGVTAPTVSTTAATAVGSTTATLNGNVGNLGTAPSVTLFFDYGTSTSYGSTTAATPSSLSSTGTFSLNLTGLTPGQTYHYRAVIGASVHSGGSVVNGSDATFTAAALPTVTINIVTSPTNLTTQTITGTMSGAGAVVTLSSSTGATFGTVTYPTGSTWSCVATLTADRTSPGNNSITARVTDLSGNTITASTSIVVDTIAPTVTINQASAQPDPTNASPIHFTVIFSEPVTDFATGDVTVSSGTAVVTGSGTTYDVTVSGMSQGVLTATIATGVAHDAAGNANTTSTSTDNTVTYDTVGPTVTINQASGQVDPTNASTINFTVVFNKSVSDFTTGDVTLSGTAGATTAVVTGSGTTYNVAVSGMTTPGTGTVIATIATGVAHDALGNASSASTSTDNSVTYDTVPPTITITTVMSYTNQATVTIQGTREANATVTMSGSATYGTVTYPDATHWSVSATLNANTSNTISATATDAAGNTAGTGTSIIYDNTLPVGPTDLASSSHIVSHPSSNNVIVVTWTDATDAVSGLGGYSIAFDTSASTLPGTTKTVNAGVQTATSTTLADGTYYFHIRAVDNAGNWATTAVTIGPFIINTAGIPTMETITEAQSQYYKTAPTFANFGFDTPVGVLTDVWYQIDSYTGTWTSLVTGNATAAWHNNGWAIPGFSALAEGTHTIYFKALNDTDLTAGAGGQLHWQFFKDTTPPAAPTGVASTSHTTGVVSNNNKITVTWTAAVDSGSGLDGYSIVWDTSPSTIPGTLKTTDKTVTTLTSAALADGTSYYFHIRPVDAAGNWATTAVTIGPFLIDTTPPTVTGVSPASGTLTVNANGTVQITFSEAMNQTATAAAFSLTNNATSTPVAVIGTPTWNLAGTVLTFTPTSLLPYSTNFTITVATGARDIAGNTLATAYTSTFRTRNVLTRVDITPKLPVIPMRTGGTQQFTVTGTYSDGSTQNLTSDNTTLVTTTDWRSSNTSVATITTNARIAAAGLATTLKVGNTVIGVSVTTSDTGTSRTLTDSTIFTVAPPVLTGIIISTSQSSPAAVTTTNIAVGRTQQYYAFGTYSDGTTNVEITKSCVWSSSPTSPVAFATIDASGLATANAAGTAVITASMPLIIGSPITATTNLVVGAAVVDHLEISPGNPTIPNGTTLQFSALAYYSDGSVQNKTADCAWTATTLASSGTATIGAATGLATGTHTGTVTIQATLTGTAPVTTVLTVTAPTVVSIHIRETAPTVAAGQVLQLHVDAIMSDGTTGADLTSSATWASLSPSATFIASGLTAGQVKGLVKTTSAAPASITVTYMGMKDTVNLTVTDAVLTGITVKPATADIPIGLSVPFSATGTYSDASTKDITSQVTWATSNAAKATITTGGLVSGVAAATGITITASVTPISGTATINVIGATLSSIAIDQGDSSVILGVSKQFTATGTYSDASTADVTNQVAWTSATATVATIGANTGLAASVSQGTSVITASINTPSGLKTATATLTVTAPVVRSIAVTPATASIPKGKTQQYKAVASYSDGTSSDVTNTATWTPGNTAVATINTAGLATGAGLGTTTIKATLGGVDSPTVSITITAKVLTAVAITGGDQTVNAGAAPHYTATGTYSDGTAEPNATSMVTWSSSNPDVGYFSSLAPPTVQTITTGTTTITASVSTAATAATATLTVNPAVLSNITVTPPVNPVPTIIVGKTQQFRAMGTYTDGSVKDLTTQVTWTGTITGDNRPDVATISTSGLAAGVARSPTNMDITATLGSVSGASVLKVINASLTVINITSVPTPATVNAGETVQFTAKGNYDDGTNNVDISKLVTWTSSNTAVAKINAAGLATSYAPGSTTITASSGGLSATGTLTVNNPVLKSIKVAPLLPDVTYISGAAPVVQFKATGVFSDGSTQDLTGSVTWASDTTTAADFITATAGEATTKLVIAVANPVITATDVASGLHDSTTLTVRPDKTAPVVKVSNPADGSITQNKNLTVSGTVDDIHAAVTITVNSRAPTSALTVDSNGNFSQSVVLDAGNNTVAVNAVDGAGNAGSSGTRHVTVDANKPNVSISRPNDGLLTNNPNVTVTGTATGAATVTVRINATTQAVSVSASGVFTVTGSLAEGKNIITAYAYTTGHDGDDDYKGTSGTKTVTLDTTAPVVTVIAPSSGSVVSTPGITITGTVDDPSVTLALLIVNNGAASVMPVAGGNFSQNVALVPGDNNILIITTDRVGNTTTAGPIVITFDNTKPNVTITSPANKLITNAGGQVVTGTVDDPTITTATLYLNGTPRTISIAPNGSFNEVVALNEGSNTIEVRASDAATPPNTGTSGVINVTLDTTPPNITVGLSEPEDSISILVSSDKALKQLPSVSITGTKASDGSTIGPVAVTMTRIGVNQWVGTYGSDTTPIVAGTYNVTINCTDKAGNVTTKTATFTKTNITVDGVNPTTVSSSSTTLEVETNGSVNTDFTVTQHMENPAGNAGNPAGADNAAAFVEINANTELRNNLKQIYIEVAYDPAQLPAGTDESSLKLYIWDITEGVWKLVPDSGVDTVRKVIYGTVTHLSKYGAFGGTVTTPAVAGGVAATQPGYTNVSNQMDASGTFTSTVVAPSDDGKVQVTINKGTLGRTSVGWLLNQLTVLKMGTPPAAPPQNANIVGFPYNLGPDGTTFNQPVTITFTYNVNDLPKGAKESNLVLATWDSVNNKWVALTGTTVNTTTHTISAQTTHFSSYAILAYTKPAAFTVSNLTVSPTEVLTNATASITAHVANSGDLDGTYTVTLKVNGTADQTRSITLAGGTSQDVVFTITRAAVGAYTLAIDNQSATLTVKEPAVTTTAPVLTPAAFTTSGLTVSPASVNTGETATVSVTVANTGEQQGTYKVTLNLNGSIEDTKDVTLDGGASQKVTFTVTKSVAGTYNVGIDSLSRTLSVVAPVITTTPVSTTTPAVVTKTTTTNWGLIWGLIGAVIVIALVAVWFIRRRSKTT